MKGSLGVHAAWGSTHVRMRLAQVARLDERQPRYKCSVGEHVRNIRKVKALLQRVSPKDAVVDRLLLYSVNHEVAQKGSFVPPLESFFGT